MRIKMLGLKEEIDGCNGYSTRLKLEQTEVDVLRQMIHAQWLHRLQLVVPEKVYAFDQAGMENYHTLSHLVDHATVWPKHTRILPREVIPFIEKLNFYKQLTKEFGDFKVSDEERFGWSNIYWRLVRPGID